MAESFTLNYNWPKPDTEKNIDEEFYRFRDVTLDAIDAALKAVQIMAEGKAAATHSHPMSQIQGLIDALNGKMAANRTFTLDDLGDVSGAGVAPTNYVLVKSSDGGWVASSALAALGQHGHTVAEVTGLTSALSSKADALAVNSALQAVEQAVAGRLRYLPTGVALPTSNVGPLWHDDYAGVLTWQVFNANGANYAGYASAEVGMPMVDGQPTPRPGYIKRNGASLSKATYAALWNWAQHNGLVVPLGSWASGPFWFADNGNGTFRLPDNRGEFERGWDDARGVDASRVFGSLQAQSIESHAHTASSGGAGSHTHSVRTGSGGTGTDPLTTGNGFAGMDTAGGYSTFNNIVAAVGDHAHAIVVNAAGGPETRPRNVALLYTIKF